MRPGQFARPGRQHRAGLDEAARAHLGGERLADGVFRDRLAVLVLSRAERADCRRHRAAEKAVHHHVGVLGVDPDLDVRRGPMSPVLMPRIWRSPSLAAKVREPSASNSARIEPRLRHEPLPGDDKLRVLELARRQPLEEVVDRIFDDLDVFAVRRQASAFGRFVDACALRRNRDRSVRSFRRARRRTSKLASHA